MSWSPDGTRLATGGYADGHVSIWSGTSGARLADAAGHEGPVVSLAWPPSGQVIASGGHDGTVRIWSAAGSPLHILTGHGDLVGALAWAPDGALLATASDDRTIRLWNPNAATCELILAGGRDPSGGGWQLTTRSPAADLVDEGARAFLQGHTDSAEHIFLDAVSHDPANATVCLNMAVVRLRQSRPAEAIPWVRRALALDPAVRAGTETLRAAVAQARGTLAVEDAAYRAHAVRVISGGHEDYIRGLAWSPDGAFIASGGYDATVRLWDLVKRAMLPAVACDDNVFTVDWSSDGTHLAAAGNERVVYIWAVDPHGGGLLPDSRIRLELNAQRRIRTRPEPQSQAAHRALARAVTNRQSSRSRSIPTRQRSRERSTTALSACGRCVARPRLRWWALTRSRSTTWRGRRPARYSPPPVATGLCGSGQPPATSLAAVSRHRAGSGRLPGRRTVRCLPVPATTVECGCGTYRR